MKIRPKAAPLPSSVKSAFIDFSLFFFNATATTEIYTLSLHDALPILKRSARSSTSRSKGRSASARRIRVSWLRLRRASDARSEEHTSELQSHSDLVCRLLLEKKKTGQFCFRQQHTNDVHHDVQQSGSD